MIASRPGQPNRPKYPNRSVYARQVVLLSARWPRSPSAFRRGLSRAPAWPRSRCWWPSVMQRLDRLDDFVCTGWRGCSIRPFRTSSARISAARSRPSARGIWLVRGPAGRRQPDAVVRALPTVHGRWHNRCDSFAILGEHVPGAYAEFVCVPARNSSPVPAAFPDNLAAAAPLVCVTAWHMLITAGRVRAGETVLVVGAGGGSTALPSRSLSWRVRLPSGYRRRRRESHQGTRRSAPTGAIDRAGRAVGARRLQAANQPARVDVVVDNVGGRPGQQPALSR